MRNIAENAGAAATEAFGGAGKTAVSAAAKRTATGKTAATAKAKPRGRGAAKTARAAASGAAAGKSAAAKAAKSGAAKKSKSNADSGIVRVELPPKFVPLFSGPARYRCAYGGRGSGKTRSFAKMAAIRGLILARAGKMGLIVCAREFMNALSDSSLAEVKQAILSEPWLAAHYDLGENYIRTKDKRINFAFIGLKHNSDSVKSKARIHILWVDEAENIAESVWRKLIPTVREDGSEIWVSWNPESRLSATHQRFRENPPANAKNTAINWRDNPWFPAVLEAERQADRQLRPDYYPHIWEGDFADIIEGAYYAKALAQARAEGRMDAAAEDPLMSLSAFWDIGGAGARADATAIWLAQFIGEEIRVLAFYEAQGQPLEAHIDWLQAHGYGRARMVLPHDGATRDRVHDVSFESALRAAGFEAETIPNQGAGAARLRIEAGRRLFPRMRFAEEACRGGLLALAAYHEKRDAARNIGLGPEHDWASHAADAFGLMCIAYEQPAEKRPPKRRCGGSSWMAA